MLPSPTLTRQCWLFAVGATFFAVATLRRFAPLAGAGAAWMQLKLAVSVLEWRSAAVQFVGTVLFNISTGAAVVMHSVPLRRHLVWTPDVFGSLAFLISGALAVAALGAAATAIDRQTTWLNMVGCVAFGVSAAAGFVRRSGVTEDQWLANLGTFAGALCFLVAAVLGLPRFRERGPALRQSAV